MTFALLFLSGVMDQPALEVEQRQRLVAHDHHFLTVDDVGTRQVRWKISLTLTSGKANAWFPSITISVGMIARVSGTLITTFEPWPLVENTLTVPLS